jgi:DNA-binding XRE family transcriptional regulator
LRSRERNWLVEAHKRLATIRHSNDSTRREDSITKAFSDAKSAPFRAWADAEYEKARNAIRSSEVAPLVPEAKPETIGAQIKRLRHECKWTIQELADVIDIDERTIRRHEADDVQPYDRTVRAYERVFSNELKRKILIGNMP